MSKGPKAPKAPKVEDDEETGRQLFGWLERPGATFYVIVALAAVGLGSLFFDATRTPNGAGFDSLWGFYAMVGAGGLTLFVLAGRVLRRLVGRDVDYYRADDDQP